MVVELMVGAWPGRGSFLVRLVRIGIGQFGLVLGQWLEDLLLKESSRGPPGGCDQKKYPCAQGQPRSLIREGNKIGRAGSGNEAGYKPNRAQYND